MHVPRVGRFEQYVVGEFARQGPKFDVVIVIGQAYARFARHLARVIEALGHAAIAVDIGYVADRGNGQLAVLDRERALDYVLPTRIKRREWNVCGGRTEVRSAQTCAHLRRGAPEIARELDFPVAY